MLYAFLSLAWSLANNPTVSLWIFDDANRTLESICRRESHCLAVGLHAHDTSGRIVFANAMRARYLGGCLFHSLAWGSERWGTRGMYGQIAAYALQYLPCSPPEILDIPLVDTYVAWRRLQVARTRSAPPRLKSWANL